MALLNGLRVYNITFNEDPSDKEGIDFVSLVDYPAIESNWVAMSKESLKAPLKFGFNADKQILYGPILIPNKPIYRYNEQTGEEYYVVFPESTVEKLVRKFQRQAKTINLNYQHQKDSQIKEAVIQEVWLTGKPDKSESFGFDLPKNSGFVGVHIGDSKFWNDEVKSGNVMGFSIEGFLDLEMKKLKTNEIMSVKFITAKTVDGLEIKSDSETLTEGAEVYTETDGKKEACQNGDYSLDNGTVITVLDGKITAITEAEMSQEEVEIIQKAVAPIMEAMKAEFKKTQDAYEAKIAELEATIKTLPGVKSETSHDDEPAKKVVMTARMRVKTRLSTIQKKSNEIKTKTTK